MDRISGTYPGGPTRRESLGQTEANEPSPALRGGEDHERQADLRSKVDRRRSRKIRAAFGIGATLVLSAAAGIYWGFNSVRASEERMENARVRINRPEVDVSGEMDRLIDELWRMEGMERLPTGPRR